MQYKFTDLLNLKVEAPNEVIRKKILKNWDSIAKPLDGMGKFETFIAQIGAILGTEQLALDKKAVIIMCSDNGIVEEGISQCDQDVTRAVVEKMATQSSSVGKMASVMEIDTFPIDIGINFNEEIPGVQSRKVRAGTRNFMKEPAMTEAEVVQAIFTGIEIVEECKKKGYQILGTGEMGIGNTTTSSALAAVLLDCDVKTVTGRGAGLNDEKFLHKQQIIKAAIEKYHLREANIQTVLATVGGLDIAGLVGVCIGGALHHIPIVLDGVISLVAALVAHRLVPGTRDYMIPSHKGKEPAVNLIMKELGLESVIDGNMALGEGTGAVMMLGLLEMALKVYDERVTFSDMEIQRYERYETV